MELPPRRRFRRPRPGAVVECRLLEPVPPASMLDREKIVAVLERRFPGASAGQVAAAANAIVGLDEEWEEVALSGAQFNNSGLSYCNADCWLRTVTRGGASIRVYRKTSAD